MLWPRERWENRRESPTWHCGSVFFCAQYATDSLIRDCKIHPIGYCPSPVYKCTCQVVLGVPGAVLNLACDPDPAKVV